MENLHSRLEPVATRLSADQFAELVVASGVATSDTVATIRRSVPGASADELSFAMVGAGVITEWHREKLLAGKYKGFILGKYKLLRLIDSGGMAHVFLAQHLHMDRIVAIKVLPPKRSASEDSLMRFQFEAQAIASLDHPNIVKAFDFDREGAIHYLVMEFVDGPNLQRLVEENGPVDPLVAAEMIRQTCLGLHHAHEIGMIHRDVKPANIMWEAHQTIRILDLGLVRIAKLMAFEDGRKSVLGTTDYVAPEQALNSQTIDGRADLYSLGCTLYFLLSGRPPFPEGTIAQRLLMHQMREPEPLEKFRSDIPAEMIALCKSLMMKRPSNRPENAAAVALTMAEFLKNAAKPEKTRPVRTASGCESGQQAAATANQNKVKESREGADPSKGKAASSSTKGRTAPSKAAAAKLPPPLEERPVAKGGGPSEGSTTTSNEEGIAAAASPIVVKPPSSVLQSLRERRRGSSNYDPAWLWLIVLLFLLATILLYLRFLMVF